MSIVAQKTLVPHPWHKLREIQMVVRAVRAVSRRCLELSLQGLLRRWVDTGLAQQVTPWACSRCGAQEPSAFRRAAPTGGAFLPWQGTSPWRCPDCAAFAAPTFRSSSLSWSLAAATGGTFGSRSLRAWAKESASGMCATAFSAAVFI